MPALGVTPRIEDGDWKDLLGQHPVRAEIKAVGLLPEGMESGDPTFEMAMELGDGTKVYAETSWRVMRAALRALEASPLAPQLRDIP